MSDRRNPLSLAAWSLHQTFESGEIDQLGMVQLAGKLGFTGFEMENTFFPVPTNTNPQELRSVAEDAGLDLVLIMCDEESDLAALDRAERLRAARNHRRWVDIAATLAERSVSTWESSTRRSNRRLISWFCDAPPRAFALRS